MPNTIQVVAIRATACGHVIAMAAPDPRVVAELERRFSDLSQVDDRFELTHMGLDEATDAYAAGLGCHRCVIDPIAAARRLRARQALNQQQEDDRA